MCRACFAWLAVLLAAVACLPARAQTVASLSLTPSLIAGGSGASATGTINLAAPAPAGGAVVILASSEPRLAAVQPSVTVPAGETSASFVVGTNPLYRRYSALAFTVTITASDAALNSTAFAALNITAQARPGPFTGGTHSADQTRRDGNICGGAVEAGSAVERGILYSCVFPPAGGFSVCSFLQECAFGCVHDPQFAAVGSPVTLQDSCAIAGPAPIVLDPNPLTGGGSSAGTLLLGAPAGEFSQAQVSSNPPLVTPLGNFPIPTGDTSAPFRVDTLQAAVPSFLQINASIFTNPLHRFAQDHLAVVPPADSVPPAGPLALFGLALRPASVVGGDGSQVIGIVSLNGAAPAGGAIVSLSRDNAVATMPASVTVPAGQTSAFFTISAARVTTATPVLITASFGGASRTATLTVNPPPPAVALAGLTLNPPGVVGGASSTGTVILDRPAPEGGTVVPLTRSHAVATLPASVTVPAGATTASFTVATTAVTVTTQVTISGSLNFASQQAFLTVSPVPPPISLATLSLNPTSIVGGNFRTSTGSVTLSAPAPAGGAMVNLSRDNAAVIVPAWITVPAGATSASFSVSTLTVASDTVATIIGSFGTATRTATLTVRREPLVSLAVSPVSVIGGGSAIGTVTLASPAPAGGTVVALSDVSEVTSVPPSVTVPAGATSASFTVATIPVAETFSANLFATLEGVTRQALLSVLPSGGGTAPALSSVSVSPSTVVGGSAATGTVTLSASTPGALTVSLADNSAAVSVPAGVTVPAGASAASFSVTTSPVTASTSATITASLGGVARSAGLTLTAASVPAAPTLLSPQDGANVAQPVTLDWSDVANAASYEVQIDNSSTIAAPFVANQQVSGSQLTLSGLPAQRLWWRVRARNAAGVFGPFSSVRRFTPQGAVAPSLAALSVTPTTVVGPASATGTATLSTAAPSGGAVVALASSSAVAGVPASVTVAAGATSASFPVTASAVTTATSVTLSGSYGGTTRSTVLSVAPPAALDTLTLSPSSVTPGNPSTGTVRLTSAAPAGGLVVSLASDLAAVSVPASVTVAAGATSASFTALTSPTSAISANISASVGGVTRSAVLALVAPGAGATLTVTATGRSGERVLSSPAGISVPVGSTGSATFAAGTSITLSVSNGRDAIWSGGCSSGGEKRRSCTFTLNGAASVTGNVQ